MRTLGITSYAAAATEKAFQQQVTDLCDWYHLRWHHETDSRRSKAGFPDLVIVGKRVIFVELKSERGRVSKAQRGWITDLERAGAEVHVWRPSEWDAIHAILADLKF